MANPTFEVGSLPRRKRPGVALTGKDAATVVESYGVHNTVAPTLSDGDVCPTQMDDLGNVKTALGDPSQLAIIQSINGFQIPVHDEIVLTYSGDNISTVVYKYSAATVATLTLSYDGSDNLTGVVKS